MSYASLPLGPLRVLTIIGLVVGLSAAILFALQNTASKTIALATAALSGAALLYIVQLALELRSSEESDYVTVEFTIDRAKPALYSPYNSGIAVWRGHYEQGASEWLAKNSPEAFSGDRERLTDDFALAEILLFFARAQPDWRFATANLKGERFSVIKAQPVSEETNDYTEVEPADFAAALKNAGNSLAGYESQTFPGPAARLPPGTKIIPNDKSWRLSNRFGSLDFTVVSSSGAVSLNPERNEPSPTMPNGEPEFETRVFFIRVVNRQTALYSQHRDAAKQAAWRKRVISGLHSFFEKQ